jgi:hypothetical protein
VYMCVQAFLAAWEMACTVESAEVNVPSGYTFLVYPSTFSGPCQEDLHFSVCFLVGVFLFIFELKLGRLHKILQ